MPTVTEADPDSKESDTKPATLEPLPLGIESTPNVPPSSLLSPAEGDECDDDEDETLGERLLGLGEMFPGPVRNVTSRVVGFSWNSAKWMYSMGRSGAWVVASSAIILALPVMFEVERAQMEEHQLQQQRQILLGPNAAVAGAGSGLMPGAMPQVMPPPPAR